MRLALSCTSHDAARDTGGIVERAGDVMVGQSQGSVVGRLVGSASAKGALEAVVPACPSANGITANGVAARMVNGEGVTATAALQASSPARSAFGSRHVSKPAAAGGGPPHSRPSRRERELRRQRTDWTRL